MQNGERIHHSDSAFVGGGAVEDPQLKMLAEGQGEKSSLGSSSSTIKQVSQEQPAVRRFDRTKPAAAQALTGLRFISKTGGATAWTNVEKLFDELTSTTNGMLPRSLFGKCIGKVKYNLNILTTNMHDHTLHLFNFVWFNLFHSIYFVAEM